MSITQQVQIIINQRFIQIIDKIISKIQSSWYVCSLYNFYISQYSINIMRQDPPLSYGCSFSLLSFDLKVGPSAEYYQRDNRASLRTQRNTHLKENKNHSNLYGNKGKKSLKNRHSPVHSFKSIQPSILSPRNASSILPKQYQDFSELSSVIEPRPQKYSNQNSNHCICACKNNNKQNITSKRNIHVSSIKNPNYDKQNVQNQQFSKNTQTVLVPDHITLNQQSQEQESKQKQRSSLIKQNQSITNQRRVYTQYTEYNQQECLSPASKFQIQNSKRPYPHITRSQYFSTHQSNRLQFSPSVASSALINKSPNVYKQVKSPKNTIAKTSRTNHNQLFDAGVQTELISPTMKRLETKNNIYEQSNSQLKIYQPEPHQLNLIFNQSNMSHIRKVSSPRFQKPFRTLIDFNCKNAVSSGGERTSSNHVSIVASQDLNNSHPEQNGQFTRVIKMMTLKNLPLNQQLWSGGSRQR